MFLLARGRCIFSRAVLLLSLDLRVQNNGSSDSLVRSLLRNLALVKDSGLKRSSFLQIEQVYEFFEVVSDLFCVLNLTSRLSSNFMS